MELRKVNRLVIMIGFVVTALAFVYVAKKTIATSDRRTENSAMVKIGHSASEYIFFEVIANRLFTSVHK